MPWQEKSSLDRKYSCSVSKIFPRYHLKQIPRTNLPAIYLKYSTLRFHIVWKCQFSQFKVSGHRKHFHAEICCLKYPRRSGGLTCVCDMSDLGCIMAPLPRHRIKTLSLTWSPGRSRQNQSSWDYWNSEYMVTSPHYKECIIIKCVHPRIIAQPGQNNLDFSLSFLNQYYRNQCTASQGLIWTNWLPPAGNSQDRQ